MPCNCPCHPGPHEHNSTNSVVGCCWWNHLTEEQERDSHVLLWKCYRFLKRVTTVDWQDEGTEREFAALYRLVADRVHLEDFPSVPW